ncbi:MAG TPA: hypothetical protein PLQ76_04460, partial [bacterium]|nr:hypothetical protein [bacterium]
MSAIKKTTGRNTHTVVVGDSRNMKEIDSESVHLVILSPPIWKPGGWSKTIDIGRALKFNSYTASLRLVFEECLRVLKPGCHLCAHISNELEHCAAAMKKNISPSREIENELLGAGFIRAGVLFTIRENPQNG